MSVLFVILARLAPNGGPEIPGIALLLFLFAIDCRTIWAFWPF